MDVEIWSDEQVRFFGLCVKRGPAYLGPYPTTVLQFRLNVLLLSANSWLYLVDVNLLRVLHSRNFRQQIMRLACGKKMVLIVLQTQIQLLNDQLQTVRTFEMQEMHQVVDMWYTTKGFLVHYQGNAHLSSQPLVKFVKVCQQPACCYYQNVRIRYERGLLVLQNTDNSFTENVLLTAVGGLPQQAASLECKEIGAVLIVIIDKNIGIALAIDDHRFLYSVSCGKLLKQLGPYLAEVKGKLINITFLDESGPLLMGTVPVMQDELEALLPVGSNYYAVRQVLQDGQELRRIEKCQLTTTASLKCLSEPLLPSMSNLATSPVSPRDFKSFSTAVNIKPSQQFTAWSQVHRDKQDEDNMPKFRRWESEERPPGHSSGYSMHEDHIPCSPIVEIVENHKNLFTVAKDLFLVDNIEEDPQEQSVLSEQRNSFTEDNSGQTSKFAFVTNYKLSFGSMEALISSPEKPKIKSMPSTPQEFLAKKGETFVSDLLAFMSTLEFDQRPSDVTLKKLSVLEHINLSEYRLLCSSQPTELLEDLYLRHDKKLQAIQLFFEEVLKFQPEAITELLESLSQEERLAKMSELLNRLSNDALRKKLKRECYRFLSDMPLKSVPAALLTDPLSPQHQNLLLFFYPEVKVTELTNPTELIANVLNIYFSDAQGEQLASDCVQIEGETIQITNPRNMLNIVLYFSEIFECSAEEAIRRYLLVLLSKNLIDLVDHIIYTEGVLELCGLPTTLVQQIIKNYERELYYKEGQSLDDFQQCLELVRQDQEYKRKAACRLNIIQALARENVLIMFSDVYVLDQLKNGFQFLSKIIHQESPEVVISVGLESLYENVWILEDIDNKNSKLSFYTRELLELVQALIVRCFECSRYEEGVDCMLRIRPRLKLGMIVYGILQYLKNEKRANYEDQLNTYMPLLKRYNKDSLLQLLNALCKEGKQLEQVLDEYSEAECGFVCSYSLMYEKFKRFNGVLRDDALLPSDKFCSLLFNRSKVAIVMARYDKGVNNLELKKYLATMQKLGYFNRIEEKKHKPNEICPELPISLTIKILERWTPEPRSPAPSSEMPSNEVHVAEHNHNFDSEHVKRTNSVEHLLVNSNHDQCKSMVTEDPRSRKKKEKKVMSLRRRESSPESLDISEIKRLQKNTADVREYLCEFYSKRDCQDLQRLLGKAKIDFPLYWIEKLKAIQEYDITYDYHRIFTFDFLCQKDTRKAFEVIRPHILRQLSERTFWVVAYIVGHVLGEDYSRNVAVMYIQGLLHNWKDDCLEEEQEQIQAVIEFYALPNEEIVRLTALAEELCLNDVGRLLTSHEKKDTVRRLNFSTGTS